VYCSRETPVGSRTSSSHVPEQTTDAWLLSSFHFRGGIRSHVRFEVTPSCGAMTVVACKAVKGFPRWSARPFIHLGPTALKLTHAATHRSRRVDSAGRRGHSHRHADCSPHSARTGPCMSMHTKCTLMPQMAGSDDATTYQENDGATHSDTQHNTPGRARRGHRPRMTHV
jgi:hypothetical protein